MILAWLWRVVIVLVSVLVFSGCALVVSYAVMTALWSLHRVLWRSTWRRKGGAR